jgi:hypothetical protein
MGFEIVAFVLSTCLMGAIGLFSRGRQHYVSHRWLAAWQRTFRDLGLRAEDAAGHTWGGTLPFLGGLTSRARLRWEGGDRGWLLEWTIDLLERVPEGLHLERIDVPLRLKAMLWDAHAATNDPAFDAAYLLPFPAEGDAALALDDRQREAWCRHPMPKGGRLEGGLLRMMMRPEDAEEAPARMRQLTEWLQTLPQASVTRNVPFLVETALLDGSFAVRQAAVAALRAHPDDAQAQDTIRLVETVPDRRARIESWLAAADGCTRWRAAVQRRGCPPDLRLLLLQHPPAGLSDLHFVPAACAALAWLDLPLGRELGHTMHDAEVARRWTEVLVRTQGATPGATGLVQGWAGRVGPEWEPVWAALLRRVHPAMAPAVLDALEAAPAPSWGLVVQVRRWFMEPHSLPDALRPRVRRLLTAWGAGAAG